MVGGSSTSSPSSLKKSADLEKVAPPPGSSLAEVFLLAVVGRSTMAAGRVRSHVSGRLVFFGIIRKTRKFFPD